MVLKRKPCLPMRCILEAEKHSIFFISYKGNLKEAEGSKNVFFVVFLLFVFPSFKRDIKMRC